MDFPTAKKDLEPMQARIDRVWSVGCPCGDHATVGMERQRVGDPLIGEGAAIPARKIAFGPQQFFDVFFISLYKNLSKV